MTRQLQTSMWGGLLIVTAVAVGLTMVALGAVPQDTEDGAAQLSQIREKSAATLSRSSRSGGGVAGPCPGPGDCCVFNGTPGCNDVTCCAAICAIDPICCATAWDFICADEAAADPVNCPQCQPPPPNDNCQDAVIDTLVCDGTLIWTGDNTNASLDCTALSIPEVWHAFTINDLMDVTVAYCGTTPAFANSYIVMAQSCPCPGPGDLIFASGSDNTSCGDGNWTVYWTGLTAGTYYYPVYTEPGSMGPYTITVISDCVCGPGSGDCCSANGTPGCDDATCCNAICAIDPYCCDTEWDNICVGEAAADPINCPKSQCSGPSKTFTIEIMTDDYPDETTWNLVHQDTGAIVASAGPLADPATLHTWDVPVTLSPNCYNFTIFDAYGDGICCDYGMGYYNVYHEGILVGSGGEFGTLETISYIGGECEPLIAACCLWDGSCIDVASQADCDALGGTYQGDGTDCANTNCQPPPAGANFFLDPASFDAALAAAGKVSKVTWDFAPNILPPGAIIGLDDPVNINSHAGTWGDPWAPNLWPPEVDNVTFQSNLGPHPVPPVPNPRGIDGVALGNSFSPFDNNILVAYYYVDSLDIISGLPAGDNHTAMGLHLVTVEGAGPIFVTVYDKSEVPRGMIKVDVRPAQEMFLGILMQGSFTIGRVNLWDRSDGGEGISAFTLYLQSPLPNDECGGALPISNGNTVYDMTGATVDTTDCFSSGLPSVYYDYTSNFTGDLTISVCDDLDFTGIDVFDGCGCPTNVGDQLACASGNVVDPACGFGFRTEATFPVVIGGCYKIRLTTVLESTGTITITKGPGSGPVNFFFNQGPFDEAVAAAGKLLKGVEDFEEANIPDGTCSGINDPLDVHTSDGIFFAGDILCNLAFQSNLDSPGVNGPNPRGLLGMAACGPGAGQGSADKAVSANTYSDSTDILSLNPNHTAMALRIADIGFASGPIEVRVFDKNEVLLGGVTVDTTLPGTFIGFVMKDQQTFGRVNLSSTGPAGSETIYIVRAYVNPGACPADLDGDGDVDSGDLTVLLGAWAAGTAAGDINGDCDTDSADLTLLLGAWAAGGCP